MPSPITNIDILASQGMVEFNCATAHERDHDLVTQPKGKVGVRRGGSKMPSWTCEICDQVAELRDDDRPRWSAKAYESCKLRYHYVDNACIAHTHPDVAKELIRMATAAAV